jgi:hypothetical protein
LGFHYCNIRENLLQQKKKANATSQALLLQHQKNVCCNRSTATSGKNCNIRKRLLQQQQQKIPLQHSKSFIATLKQNHSNNDEI